MHYNRKQRKQLMKQLGISTKNETRKTRQERVTRSIEAGKQIHAQFIMQVENDVRNQLSEKEAKKLESTIASHGEEFAKRMQENNARVEQERKDKQRAKKERRESAGSTGYIPGVGVAPEANTDGQIYLEIEK